MNMLILKLGDMFSFELQQRQLPESRILCAGVWYVLLCVQISRLACADTA